MRRDPGDEIDEFRDHVRVLTAGLGLAETFEIPRMLGVMRKLGAPSQLSVSSAGRHRAG